MSQAHKRQPLNLRRVPRPLVAYAASALSANLGFLATIVSSERPAVSGPGTTSLHTLLPLDDCLYALQATIPHLTRMDFIVLDELGYLPLAQSGGQAPVPPRQPALRANLHRRHHQPRLR